MRIRIENKTWYRSDDIRKIVRKALKAERVTAREYTVEVVYSRSGDYMSGLAYINSTWFKMCVPKHQGNWADGVPFEFTPERIERFAQIVVHEVRHTRGLRHRDMIKSKFIKVPWSEGMAIRRQESKPKKSSVEKASEKEAHARKKVDEYERKIKRHQTLLKKWKRKVSYYERRQASLAASQEKGEQADE